MHTSFFTAIGLSQLSFKTAFDHCFKIKPIMLKIMIGNYIEIMLCGDEVFAEFFHSSSYHISSYIMTSLIIAFITYLIK